MPDTSAHPFGRARYGIGGRVVTMDDSFRVVPDATVWVDGGLIAGVTGKGEGRPDGFEDAPLIRTGGTLYPGMIELHNHLPYNVLGMWSVPQPYTNRGQWGSHDDYRRLVSGPMKVLGKTVGYIEAVVRYVEVKALVSGVTTSQGVALYSNAGTRRYHRGLVRNVESTDDHGLPPADSRVADVDAEDAAGFLERLRRGKKIILHLAEGVDETARNHFRALHLGGSKWAITEALVGIHSAALDGDDLEVLGSNGAAMVWSPCSNLMLYGGTARVDLARRHGVRVALGSDWAPTGSKNLLAELKVARAAARAFGWDLENRDLVSMVTREAASALGWESALGSIEAGRRADFVVLHGDRRPDPYAQLVDAGERSVTLVVIAGIPRYGQPRFFAGEAEGVRVAGSDRALYLDEAEADPVVAPVTFRAARRNLEEGLRRLPALARELEEAAGVASTDLGGTRGIPPATELGIARGGERWVLELEHEEPDGTTIRPSFGLDDGLLDLGPVRAPEALSTILEPLELDPLTVADDSGYRRRLVGQMNIPASVKAAL